MKKALSAILALLTVSACILSLVSCDNGKKPAETTPTETTPAVTDAETKPAETKPVETKPEVTTPVTEAPDIFAAPCYITDHVDMDSVKLVPEGSEEDGEGAENLFDNDTYTKLCSVFDTVNGAEVTFKLSAEEGIAGATVSAINFGSCNDSVAESGRNPTSYKLYGSNDEGVTWELIAENEEGFAMPTADLILLDSDIAITSTTAYSTFKIAFPTIIGDAHIQVSEVQIFGQLVKAE